MSILDSISLFLVMVALAAAPSSSVALVVSRSATMGIANGVAVSTGIVLGDLVFVSIAILGLSAIADALGAFFVVVRYLGGAYLLWIGYSLLAASNAPTSAVCGSDSTGSLLASFISGFVLTLGDVKAIFFYASLFPTFVDLTSVSTVDLLTIFVITVAAVGGVKIAYAIGARKVADMAQTTRLQNSARTAAGSFMIGAGAYLILKT